MKIFTYLEALKTGLKSTDFYLDQPSFQYDRPLEYKRKSSMIIHTMNFVCAELMGELFIMYI